MAKTKTSFQKGHKPTKPKGAVSQKTKMWNEIGQYILCEGSEKALSILMRKQGDEFLKYYILILEYFAPKLQRTELKHEGEITQRIEGFNYIKPE